MDRHRFLSFFGSMQWEGEVHISWSSTQVWNVLPLYFFLVGPLQPLYVYTVTFAPDHTQWRARAHAHTHTHTHTHTHPPSVWLLWTSDQSDAESFTGQQRKFTRDTHPSPCGIRRHSPNKRAAADLRLRPHGFRDRQRYLHRTIITGL
jgi:hypothetical protein